MYLSKSASKASRGKRRPHSKYSQTGYVHAERSAEWIAENEARFQVMMLMRKHPALWLDLFIARNAGRSWLEIDDQFDARRVPSETNLLPIPNNPD